MKNIEVDNRIMNDGREEMDKVLDWYQLAGWIVPCQKCGTWLTSLGLCSDCGIRYEIVLQANEESHGRFVEMKELATQLCYAIESLPASEEQTKVSIMASDLSQRLKAVEQLRALDGATYCPSLVHFYVDGSCARCGHPEPPRQ